MARETFATTSDKQEMDDMTADTTTPIAPPGLREPAGPPDGSGLPASGSELTRADTTRRGGVRGMDFSPHCDMLLATSSEL